MIGNPHTHSAMRPSLSLYSWHQSNSMIRWYEVRLERNRIYEPDLSSEVKRIERMRLSVWWSKNLWLPSVINRHTETREPTRSSSSSRISPRNKSHSLLIIHNISHHYNPSWSNPNWVSRFVWWRGLFLICMPTSSLVRIWAVWEGRNYEWVKGARIDDRERERERGHNVRRNRLVWRYCCYNYSSWRKLKQRFLLNWG